MLSTSPLFFLPCFWGKLHSQKIDFWAYITLKTTRKASKHRTYSHFQKKGGSRQLKGGEWTASNSQNPHKQWTFWPNFFLIVLIVLKVLIRAREDVCFRVLACYNKIRGKNIQTGKNQKESDIHQRKIKRITANLLPQI